MRTASWLMSLAALAALGWLIARTDLLGQAPGWSQAVMERRIGEASRAMGLNTAGWKVMATSAFNEDFLRLIHRDRLPWRVPFSPVTYIGAAQQGHGPAWVRVRFAAGGELLEWECNSCAQIAREPVHPAGILRLLAGERESEFQLKESGASGSYWRWTWTPGATSGIPVEARVTLDEGRVRKVELGVTLREAQREALRPAGHLLWRITRVTSEVLGVLALILAGIVLAFRSWGRRDVWRLAAGLALFSAAIFLAALASEGWAWEFGETLRGTGRGSRANWVVRFLLVRPWRWVLAAGAGLLLLRGEQTARWIGFGHALIRWRKCRRTGLELLQGLCWGPVLALPAYLLASFGGPVWGLLSPRVPFEANPVLAAPPLTYALGANLLLFFGFVVPAAFHWIGGRKARTSVTILTGVLFFGGMGHFLPLSPWGGVATGLLTGAVSWAVFARAGLMGLLGAWLGSAAGGALAWLAISPAAHPVPTALSLCTTAGLLAGAAYLRARPSLTEDSDLESELRRRNDPADAGNRSERARLQAEFSEARQAQQGMLPSRLPQLAHYSLASVCRPAREVGGDLYDFLTLPDNTVGLCVADVSGKGVPAALYMTLTKGLLASAQRTSTDLKDLAVSLNGPLREAGRRRTFVTLALARLSPEAPEVDLIRAGHNSPLWRRAARDECVYLMPKGIGLGLAADPLFSRALETERITLEPGDALVLYSDGLTEAMNSRREQFGEDRLADVVRRSDELDAGGLTKRILEAVDGFVENADPHDDLTLVVVRYGEHRGK